MYSCAVIYSSRAGARLLLTFIRRSLFLHLRYEGRPEEATDLPAQCAVDVLFVCLPPPHETVDGLLLTCLQQHSGLVAISSYPPQAYDQWKLSSKAFLVEPFTFDAFANTLQLIVDQKVTNK
jgi:hypothetical protein